MTNIVGTYNLLQSSLKYYKNLDNNKKNNFRFLHVSTDEVFGSLEFNEKPFDENSNYRPNSPYSSSKASSDHLVRAWYKTYNLPVITTNCSNNFGPNQHQEKLIPTIIKSCLQNKKIPIYGSGENIRDWIFVEDHCHGIKLALEKGKVGDVYLFGGRYEISNLELAKKICEILDQIKPRSDGNSYNFQIDFVEDRLGHDLRYSISDQKSYDQLGFNISSSFEENLFTTVKFYINCFS